MIHLANQVEELPWKQTQVNLIMNLKIVEFYFWILNPCLEVPN